MAEETGASDTQTPAASAADDNGTFVPLIFGGAVACALGFFAGQIDSIEERLGLRSNEAMTEQLAQQTAQIADQAGTIETLTARLEEVANATPDVDLSEVTGDIGAQGEALQTQADQLAALVARVDDVEKRPMTEGLSEDAVAAYQAELERLQSSVSAQQAELQTVIDAQRAEIEQLVADAQNSENSAAAQAQAALARAAMSQVITAVDSGAPYADALADLVAAGGGDIPEALAANAASGVPSISTLQTEFPGAARAALSADRATSGDSGLGSFLQRQLGARSVTPREGDSTDAVLSRAEAALREGRLGDGLAELDALPDPAKDAMSGWMAQAQTRHDALVAADELMTALAAN